MRVLASAAEALWAWVNRGLQRAGLIAELANLSPYLNPYPSTIW